MKLEHEHVPVKSLKPGDIIDWPHTTIGSLDFVISNKPVIDGSCKEGFDRFNNVTVLRKSNIISYLKWSEFSVKKLNA